MHSLKIFLINLSALLLFSGNLFAQAFNWEIIPEVGAGIRTIRIDPAYPSLETNAGLSSSSGISGQYNITEMWSVKLGAAYERKGSDLERTDINTTGEINIDYISIPLLLKAKFGNKIKYFVNAGPYLGIFLSSETTLNAYSGNPEININNDSSTKKTDFGISTGIGIEIPVGHSGAFTIEVRDNFGLTNISESKETNAPEIKNNTANLIIGYAFKFGKNYVRKK